MGFLLSLFTPAILQFVIGKFIDGGSDAFKAYVNKEITREQLAEQLKAVFLNTIASVEHDHADALSKTYATFMQAVQQSRLVRYVWAAVTLSQTGVLVAYQLGFVPPAQGIEWAYGLVAFLTGGGPILLRNGPGVLPMQSMKNATNVVK